MTSASLPEAPATGRQVRRVEYFDPPQRPNGGGTVYLRPEPSGNPYASLDETELSEDAGGRHGG